MVLEMESNCLMWLFSMERVVSFKFSVGLISHFTFFMLFSMIDKNFFDYPGSCF